MIPTGLCSRRDLRKPNGGSGLSPAGTSRGGAATQTRTPVAQETITLYLVRHGETDWNREGRLQGRQDVPLNARGGWQARQLGSLLRDHPITVAYSSPLSRARKTAALVLGGREVPLHVMPEIIEMGCGIWEGLDTVLRTQRYGDLVERWRDSPWTVALPGGETLEAVERRALAAVGQLGEKHPGEAVLFSGHALVNRVILGQILGLPRAEFWQWVQPNASAYILSVMPRNSANSPLHLVSQPRFIHPCSEVAPDPTDGDPCSN